MKGKKKALISFYIGAIGIFCVWFFSVRFNRSFDIFPDKINQLGNILEQKLTYKLNFDLTQLGQQQQQQYKEQVQTVFNKYTHEITFNSTQAIQPEIQTQNIIVKCQSKEQQQPKIQFSETNFNQITINRNCQESVQKKEVQELRRLILETHSDINEQEKSFYNKLILIDIYLYNVNETQIGSIKKQITQQIISTLLPFHLSQNNIRINYKTFQPQEFQQLDELVQKKGNFLTSQNLKKNIIDKQILFSHDQNRINYRHYLEQEILIVGKNTQKSEQIFFTNEGQKVDLVQIDQNTIISIDEFAKNSPKILQTIFSNILLDFLNLKNFLQLPQTFSQYEKLPINLQLLSQYFHKREMLEKYRSLYSQIQTLQFQLTMPENFVFSRENQQTIKEWIIQSNKITQLENNPKYFVQELQQQENLDELDSFGIIEAFTLEYTMGVYLPLLIPIAFPFIQTILNYLKNKGLKKIKAKQSSQEDKLKKE